MSDEENKEESEEVKLGTASYNLSRHYDYKNLDLFDEFLSGDKASLRNLFKKKLKREDKIRIAREFVWSIGILYRIIKLKVDFIVDGFEIYHENEDILKTFKELNDDLNIKQYIKNAAFEHEVIGEWFPFLSWEGDDLKKLTILDPEQVRIKSVFGEDFVYIKPSKEMRTLLNDPDENVQRRLKKIIPRSHYKKWSQGQEVLLNKDEVFRYCNLKPYFEGYSHSPIEPIFDDLALLSMYKESDYSVAYKIKKAILQVKVGNQEVFDGNPVPEPVLDQAEELFQSPSESSEIFTQWFMDAEWIIPDTEVYAPEKYEPVLKNILQWSGVGIFLSEGGAYSDADIKAKGFYKDVELARDEIRKSILDIYKAIAKRKGMTTYGKDNYKFPEVKFSNSTLQSNEELLEITKFLYKHGLITPETTLDIFGHDYDKEMSIKQKEGKLEEYLEYITVPFEPSQDVNMKSFLRKEMEQQQQEDNDVNIEEEEDNDVNIEEEEDNDVDSDE